MPEFTYITNKKTGLIELYVDKELMAEWTYDDEPEELFIEFKRIFIQGMKYVRK